MTWFLLDTNHLSEAVRPVSALRDRLRQARHAGHVLGTCIPVLCELESGFQQTADAAAYRRRLRRLGSLLRVWPLDRHIPHIFGELFVDLSRRGRVLSQVDIMVAALCRHMDLTLLTADRDFEALPDVRTENWLAAPSA